jgi:hypothetical protein
MQTKPQWPLRKRNTWKLVAPCYMEEYFRILGTASVGNSQRQHFYDWYWCRNISTFHAIEDRLAQNALAY